MRKLKGLATKLLVTATALMFIAGCGLQALTPKQQYLAARTAFNTMQTQYLQYYDEATPEVQAKWKANIDPRFDQLEAALDAWGLAVKDGVTTGEHLSNYMDLKNQLIDALNKAYGEDR